MGKTRPQATPLPERLPQRPARRLGAARRLAHGEADVVHQSVLVVPVPVGVLHLGHGGELGRGLGLGKVIGVTCGHTVGKHIQGKKIMLKRQGNIMVYIKY